jgi:hypothetical protein
VNNPLDVKENDKHALGFSLHLSCLFRSTQNLANTNVWLMLSSPFACQITARVSITLFPILAPVPEIVDTSFLVLRSDLLDENKDRFYFVTIE